VCKHLRHRIKSGVVNPLLQQRNPQSACATAQFQHRSIGFLRKLQEKRTIGFEVGILYIVQFRIYVFSQIVKLW